MLLKLYLVNIANQIRYLGGCCLYSSFSGKGSSMVYGSLFLGPTLTIAMICQNFMIHFLVGIHPFFVFISPALTLDNTVFFQARTYGESKLQVLQLVFLS